MTADELTLLLGSVRTPRVHTLDLVMPLPELVSTASFANQLVASLPALRDVILAARDTPDASYTRLAMLLHERCAARSIGFVAEYLLPAGASALDPFARLAGREATEALAPILEATRHLVRAGVSVRWLLPVAPSRVHGMEGIFSLARDEGVDPVLVLGPVNAVAPAWPDVQVDTEDRLFVADFVAHRLLGDERHLHGPARTRWYRALASATTTRRVPSNPAHHRIAVLRATGSPQRLEWKLDLEYRLTIGDGQAGSPWRLIALQAAHLAHQALDSANVICDGLRALAHWIRFRVSRPRRAQPTDVAATCSMRVLLIGAYGGEHIGDAAVLAGVLLRMSQRCTLTDAVLMSQRPTHTRHLMSTLDVPVHLDVQLYERAQIREALARVDAVVFAGGPLIDLPKQLVRHLYTASRARRTGIPFIMEGIGPGPFPRRASWWTARRLVGLASRVSVRTASGARHPLMENLEPIVGCDPAFDYLASRDQLTRLPDRDREWIDRLLRGTAGRVVVGLNLRPIRYLFTTGVRAKDRPSHTSLVEKRFIDQLAEGLQRYNRAQRASPCFVFFPMNAVQFGMSDLRTAYRLARRLPAEIDFRVWEGDASLDGVVALLRRLDVVIAMRFHAAVFGLALGRPVIGIDYRIGERDKVGDLLTDAGQGENCRRIDEITSDWLLQRLLSATTRARGPHGLAERE